MSLYSFNFVFVYARRRGLNIEKINRTMDGVKYRYEVYSDGAEVVYCKNLEEAMSEILSWSKKYA